MKRTRWTAHELEILRKQRAELLAALKEIRDDFDCDSDAHKYGTTCRCCLAKKVIASVNDKNNVPHL